MIDPPPETDEDPGNFPSNFRELDPILIMVSIGVEFLGTISYDWSDIPLSELRKKETSEGTIWKLWTSLEILFGAEEGVLQVQITRDEKILGKANIAFN